MLSHGLSEFCNAALVSYIVEMILKWKEEHLTHNDVIVLTAAKFGPREDGSRHELKKPSTVADGDIKVAASTMVPPRDW